MPTNINKNSIQQADMIRKSHQHTASNGQQINKSSNNINFKNVEPENIFAANNPSK